MRLALLAALLAATPAAHATEVGPGTPHPRVELGAEAWRLRPTVSGLPATAAPVPRGRPVTEIPEARRNVRVVYPALTEAR